MSRSPFGWSYPPGVTESMLPGNSKADQEDEARAEAIATILIECKGIDMDDTTTENAILALMALLDLAYLAGRQDAMADEAIAEEELRAKAEDRGRGP